ncbi:MAG: hypothetical protein QOF57_1829 [Frankiaceae bacterium]|nr:hypothetical protein [Frankiaceae bacterium]
MSVASLPDSLLELGGYVAATRAFLGTTQPAPELDEFEACLRMRVADAGAAAARQAADDAALPSLNDFLGRSRL